MATPKRNILSYGHPKDPNGHKNEILTMDISFDGKYLITAGRDNIIKIWNLTNYSFYGDLEGHKGNINVAVWSNKSVCFKFNSYECCSLSDDGTMKVWDAAQKGFMENL